MKRKIRQRRRVVLGHPVSLPWMALFARGVAEYAEQHGGWTIIVGLPPLAGSSHFELNARSLKGWTGDGAILGIVNRAEARAARRLGFPVVNLAGALCNAGLPRVMVDHDAIGRLAAEHFLERGLRRLAYCGTSGLWYSQERGRGFAERAKEAGASCETFEMPGLGSADRPWQRYVAPLGRWLQRLPRPVGLMAMNDHLARVIVGECQQLELNVPHEVAVIGSDNDTIVCEFCQPTISSVSRNAWQVGHEAAALLDSLMSGKRPPSQDILIAPDGVISRQSTDTVCVDDEQVTAAVRFMRDHLGKAVGVDAIAKHVALSRRHLEFRFFRAMGRSPHDYLCRLRVEAARRLLERPEHIKFQKLAISCGFSGSEHLRQAFRRLTGMTPLEYHRKSQVGRIR